MNKIQDKQFLLLSLDDERISKVAEVISNKTSRSILKLLSSKTLTESGIAEELKLPLSTVHYNVKKLLNSGLIEVQEYHYSKKGKEINHYSVSKQYVIFAHRIEERSLVKEFSKILTAALLSFISLEFIEYLNLNFFSKTAQNLKQEFVSSVSTVQAPVQALKSGSEQAEVLSSFSRGATLATRFFKISKELLIFAGLLIAFYLLISFFSGRINLRKNI
ncbi:MAG: ArsR/SmtB family transcription factor [Candidatus Woesearchaeota archaeon]